MSLKKEESERLKLIFDKLRELSELGCVVTQEDSLHLSIEISLEDL